MYKGLLAPVGLVQVEGVLLDFAVNSNQSFLILSLFATFVPIGTSKVTKVPNIASHKIWTFFKRTKRIVCKKQLIFLCIISLLRI